MSYFTELWRGWKDLFSDPYTEILNERDMLYLRLTATTIERDGLSERYYWCNKEMIKMERTIKRLKKVNKKLRELLHD
jgi:hypothetical protein